MGSDWPNSFRLSCARWTLSASTCTRWIFGSTRASCRRRSSIWRPADQPTGNRTTLERSSPSLELLATFRAIAELKKTHSAQAIRNFVISNTQSEHDIFAVVRLAATWRRHRRRQRPRRQSRSRPHARASVRIDRCPALVARRSCAEFGRLPSTSRCSTPGDARTKSCSATPTPIRTEAC